MLSFKNNKELIELNKYYKIARTLDLFNYYRKDNVGNLRLTVPPKELELIKSIWSKHQNVIDSIMKIKTS